MEGKLAPAQAEIQPPALQMPCTISRMEDKIYSCGEEAVEASTVGGSVLCLFQGMPATPSQDATKRGSMQSIQVPLYSSVCDYKCLTFLPEQVK